MSYLSAHCVHFVRAAAVPATSKKYKYEIWNATYEISSKTGLVYINQLNFIFGAKNFANNFILHFFYFFFLLFDLFMCFLKVTKSCHF